MKYIIEFLESLHLEKTSIFPHLKCSPEEALILQLMLKSYVTNQEEVIVYDVLIDRYSEKNYEYLKNLNLIKNLIDFGWIVQNGVGSHKETSNLELLNSSISLSSAFLKLLEDGNLDLVLPDAKPYSDHLEYLQDQFLRIDFYYKLFTLRHNNHYTTQSLGINRIKSKLKLLENRIEERIVSTDIDIVVEEIFKDKNLESKEQIIFLALLKDEYSSSEENLRDMNTLIELVSSDDMDKIKNRSLLEESSKLIQSSLIDYDEILTPFGMISRSFFINEDVLQTVMHPQKKKKRQKIRLDMLIKEQEIFELIEPKSQLDDVILNPKTKESLTTLLGQLDKSVTNLLKEWGIKDKKGSIDARIIFYGPAGTGKTMTALSLAKSMKKQVLSFDCSKILSMYIGESEKNVRKIFDTYKDLVQKSRSEPVLLLNEADQFLTARTSVTAHSADKMYNQMQNIFLEQIERFDGLLIATTNLLENIDSAFSRRFNYKIKFDKPNTAQRVELWKKMLPKNARYGSFDIDKLSTYNLTGGQINLIVRNVAYKVATRKEPIFNMEDFENEIKMELSANFDNDKSMGFLAG